VDTDGRRDGAARGFDAGTVLQYRDYIKAQLPSLSASLSRQVLEMMDRRRAGRSAARRSTPLPQMTAAEMHREILWRLATLPPGDAREIAGLVHRLRGRGR
jgi:hypothetical protein